MSEPQEQTQRDDEETAKGLVARLLPGWEFVSVSPLSALNIPEDASAQVDRLQHRFRRFQDARATPKQQAKGRLVVCTVSPKQARGASRQEETASIPDDRWVVFDLSRDVIVAREI